MDDIDNEEPSTINPHAAWQQQPNVKKVLEAQAAFHANTESANQGKQLVESSGDSGPPKPEPVCFDKDGKPVYHMDLLRAANAIDTRLSEMTAEERAAERAKAPQVVPYGFHDKDKQGDLLEDEQPKPGENPEQSVGSTHDASGRQFWGHGSQPGQAKPAAWSPQAQSETTNPAPEPKGKWGK